MRDNEATILAQWQTCVDMANATSQRRDSMNNLFATLNIALIAATSIVWDLKSIIMAVGGIILCSVWLAFVKYFRQLNVAKFKVINDLEKKLPEQPFADEWKILKKQKDRTEGTKLERILPIAFIALYVSVVAVMIISRIMEVVE